VEIVIAREVGYCYGVRDAIGMAVKEAQGAGGARVYTFGPVIHNQHTIDMLRDQHNVHTVNSAAEIEGKGSTVLIRTHGTTPAKVQELKERGCNVKDATCPFVLKTHQKARDMASEGYHLVILGHRDHPEVAGISGQVPGGCTIISKKEDVAGLERHSRIAVLFQSTVALEDFLWAIGEIAARCHEMRVFQTVCGVTVTRQKRTEEVAREVDRMIVIGGRHSSNTRKLVQISSKYCRTEHIEEPEEIDRIDFTGVRRVGISTGTSTPDFLVDRVVERLKARA
jgi:4-hydroxy-3-methylbut-2-enyl diphosphate reductase